MNDITVNEGLDILKAKLYELDKSIKRSQRKRLERENETSPSPEFEDRNIGTGSNGEPDTLAARSNLLVGDDDIVGRPSSDHTTINPAPSNTVEQGQFSSTLAAQSESRASSLIDREIPDEPDRQQNNAPLTAGPLQVVVDPAKIIDLTKGSIHFVDLTKDDDEPSTRSLKTMLKDDFVHPQNSEYSYHRVVTCLVYHRSEKQFYVVRCPQCKRLDNGNEWWKGVLGVRHHCSVNLRCRRGYPSIQNIIDKSQKFSRAQVVKCIDDPNRWLKANVA